MLRALFQALARQREYKHQREELIEAIRRKDIDAINTVIKTIENPDKFLQRITRTRWDDYFHTTVISRLLEEAIATDDTEVFTAVFNLAPDPNHRLAFCYVELHGMIDGPLGMIDGSFTLFQKALLDGKNNIGLLLANHPGFNLDEPGGDCSAPYLFKELTGNTGTVFSKPLEQARKSGMKEIEAVLENRIKARQSPPPSPNP